MGKGSSAPDPYAAAAAQAAANQKTAASTQNMNEYNQVTPYGSLNWSGSGDPNSPGGATATTTLTPAAQKLLDDSLGTSTALQSGIGSLTGQVNNSFGTPTTPPQLSAGPALAAPSLNSVNLSNVSLGGSHGLSDASGQLGTAQGVFGSSANTLAEALGNAQGNMSKGLDYSNTPGIPRLDPGTANQQEYAQFGKQMDLLRPQMAQQDEAEQNKLWSQGLAPGSEAYSNDMAVYGANKNNLLSNVANNAVMGGLNSALALNSGQLADQQQAVSQDNTAYSLPASVAAQLAGAYGTANGATSSLYNTELGQAGFKNNETLQQAGFNNGAALQQNGFNNSAAQQQTNDWNQNAITQTNMGNTAAQGNFQNQMGLQQQLLNALASLRSGTQVQNPTFAGENTSTQVGQTPINQDLYGTAGMNDQANQAMWSNLTKLAGSGALLAAGA